MGKINNIIFQRFGRLVVIADAGRNKHGKVLWLCKCDCGKETIIISNNLQSGSTRSCGCIKIENMQTHGMVETPTYAVWHDMKARCYNPNNPRYEDYGGRNIIVCERWKNSFENFFADMGIKPENRLIDRIDNNGIYEPENCRWATRIEQMRNTRKNRMIEYRGETKCLATWAEFLNINYQTLRARLNLGLIPEIAFNMQKHSQMTNR